MLKIRGLWVFWFALSLLAVPAARGQELKRDAVAVSQGGAGLGMSKDRSAIAGTKSLSPLITNWRDVTPRQKSIRIGRVELTPKRNTTRLNSIDTVFARDPNNPMGSRPGTSVTFDLHWSDR